MLLLLLPRDHIVNALETACDAANNDELLDLAERVERVLVRARYRLEGRQSRGVRGLMLGSLRDWEGEPAELVGMGGGL
jgi:hypothetical protein